MHRFVPDSLVSIHPLLCFGHLDSSTHKELANFGIVCDNIIIPMQLNANSLACNPELSQFHHSSSLGLEVFTETLWI